MEKASYVVYEPGTIIFKEGEEGNLMYILLEGVVELKMKVAGGEVVLKVIDQPNDFFGEMALIDGKPRSATAVATKLTKLLPIDSAAFESMILTNGKFALKIIKILTDRIRKTNSQVEELIEIAPKDRINRGIADFSRRTNQRIHDGSYKVAVQDLKEFINNRLGIPLDDIDTQLFRLLKAESIQYAPTSAQSKEYLIISAKFVQEYERRTL